MAAPDDQQLRTAIGPRADYYLARFEKFEQASDRWVASWNWPAFFCSSAWFAYRRMYGYSLANMLLAILAALLIALQVGPLLVVAGYLAAAFGIVPTYANRLYYLHLKRLVTFSSAGGKGADKRLRPPSFVSGVGAAARAALVFLVSAYLLVASGMYADYTPRAKVAESVAIASAMTSSITEFHAKHKRLPAAHEAGQFGLDGGPSARSFVYDADKRMVVVTLGPRDGRLEGKRLALVEIGRAHV